MVVQPDPFTLPDRTRYGASETSGLYQTLDDIVFI